MGALLNLYVHYFSSCVICGVGQRIFVQRCYISYDASFFLLSFCAICQVFSTNIIQSSFLPESIAHPLNWKTMWQYEVGCRARGAMKSERIDNQWIHALQLVSIIATVFPQNSIQRQTVLFYAMSSFSVLLKTFLTEHLLVGTVFSTYLSEGDFHAQLDITGLEFCWPSMSPCTVIQVFS